jgi:hypothetical protein
VTYEDQATKALAPMYGKTVRVIVVWQREA